MLSLTNASVFITGSLGKSVILIEHNLDAVMQVCDRVIFMDGGAKISEGKPEQVRNDPRLMTHGDDGSPLWFGYDLVHGTRRYVIDDRYCPNPQCDCQTVFFDFHQVSSETTEPICLLLVGFDGQRVETQTCHQGSQSHAKALLNQLLAQKSDLLVECKRRYKRIRQATRRILDTQPLIPKAFFEPKVSARSKIVSIPPQRPSTRIGRNSPCPCGSGRKYKQCCGGRMTVDG